MRLFSLFHLLKKFVAASTGQRTQETNNKFLIAGAAGVEPAAYGFGDRHSTN